MRKLKVWGGLTGHPQSRTIVAAGTKKRAVELLKQIDRTLSRFHFDGYWSETGNDVELVTATEEGVWVNTGAHWENKFRRLV